ncbi:MAG: ABC transporter permease [Bacteroidaceae bacterium]|nr:ABC transporter permease [Bacteroidaceae bacterium]
MNIKKYISRFNLLTQRGRLGGGLLSHSFSLIRADKLFSGIYIAGTAVAIASAMVIAIVMNILMADIKPEVNRSRTLYIMNFFQKKSQENATLEYCSTIAIDSCFRKMKCVEAAAALSDAYTVGDMEASDTTEQNMMTITLFDTNPDFFRLYEFDFISGRPFSEKEFRDGNNVCVISDKLLPLTRGGEMILVRGFPYRVVGVIKRMSAAMTGAAADVYIPYTSKAVSFDSELKREQTVGISYAGGLSVRILLKKGFSRQDFLDELEPLRKHYEAVTSAQIGEPMSWTVMAKSHFFRQISHFNKNDKENATEMAVNLMPIIILMLLFLFLPAINLSGLVSNRMETRRPEMGIRKAFGAKQGTLLSKVLFENLVLTLCGGAVGWVLSWIFICVMRDNILFKHIFQKEYMHNIAFDFDFQMCFTPTLFLICFVCCAVLNLMAALIPAWRSLKSPIVESLNQKR